MAEQSIRVTARGEFGQLQRGLKQLQGDLKNVVGEIDKGARKGGIFDESQLRALDLFKRRFEETMDTLDREFQKQNNIIDKLHEKMNKASLMEQQNIQKQINARERELDVIRRQMAEMERLYAQRTKEAGDFRSQTPPTPPPTGGGSAGAGGAGGSGGFGGDASGGAIMGILGKAKGVGGLALGLAGIGGIVGLVQQAYQLAYSREVDTLDLAQRMRGSSGRQGIASTMYDQAGLMGMNDNMGYTKQQSWSFLDQYTRMGGGITLGEQGSLQKFGRGYGLDLSEVAGSTASNQQLGGTASPVEFADMIAASVAESGMTPRVLEVMETSNTLLSQLNTTFKDGSSRQVIAYQTTLDRIGHANGMTRLTGAQGANVIGGLGGIFQPNNDKWKWMGIRALQQHNPSKYGNMGLYELERSFEDGLMNPDNLSAMSKYLKQESGGDTQLEKRMLQKWLQDGGFGASKQEVDDLYNATNGLTDLANAPNMLRKGDSGAKYDIERAGEEGQDYLQTEARYQQALEGIGSTFVGAIQDLKEGVVTVLEQIENLLTNDPMQQLYDFIKEHWKELATAAGIAGVAKILSDRLPTPGGGGGGDDDDPDTSDGDDDDDGKKAPPVVGGKGDKGGKGGKGGKVKKGAKSVGILAVLYAAYETLQSGDAKEHKQWAEAAGLDPSDVTIVDRFLANLASVGSLGMINEQEFYSGLADKAGEGIGAFFEDLFEFLHPKSEVPQTSEEKEQEKTSKEAAEEYSKNPEGQSSTMGKVNKAVTDMFREGFGLEKYYSEDEKLWGKSEGETSAYNPVTGIVDMLKFMFPVPFTGTNHNGAIEEASKQLYQLATKGQVAIDGLSLHGREQLQKLAEQGLIEFTDMGDDSTTTLTGMTEAGKTRLQALAEQGLVQLNGLNSQGQLEITALNAQGQQAISALKDGGLLKFNEWHTGTTATISGFTEHGKAELQKLEEQGLVAIGGFQTDGTAKVTALSDEGRTKLDELREKGLISIGTFEEDGRVLITKLTEEGALQLTNLQSSGSLALDGMKTSTDTKLLEISKTHDEKLGEMYDEHEDWRKSSLGIFDRWFADFPAMWDSFIETLKSYLPDWMVGDDSGGGGGKKGYGGSVDVNYNITQNTGGLSEKDISPFLKGDLAGSAGHILKYAKEYGVDPAFAVATFIQETGRDGKSSNSDVYNFGNRKNTKGGWMEFSSQEEGIKDWFAYIKRKYTDKGHTTIDDIWDIYAPKSDKANSNWGTSIANLMGEIRGGITISEMAKYDPNISTTGKKAGVRGKGYAGMTEYTTAMWKEIAKAFPNAEQNFMGGFVDRNVRGGTQKSMHAYGRAFDVGGTPQEMQRIAEFSRTLPHVQYVIYNRKISSGGGEWKAYDGASPHTDHVHVDFKYKQGTPYIPNDQVALLHEGEAVIPREHNPFTKAGGVDTSKYMKLSGNDLRNLGNDANGVVIVEQALQSTPSTSASTASSRHSFDVNVNITGEAASQLNHATLAMMEKLVRQMMGEIAQTQLRLQPTRGGW